MKLLITTAMAALLVAPAFADDSWKEDYQVIKFGVLSGENEADRLARYQPYEEFLERELGVEVEIFTAGSYDGVIQAIAADQIEFARFGSSSYAAAYTATNGAVTPLLVGQAANGNTGYISIIASLCDGDIKSLDDLAGKTLAFADPDSTSGYAVPYFNLVEEGYDPTTYFGATPFSGSHEAGITGLVNGTFDAAATWADNPENTNYHRMERKGMIEAGTVCTIWQSPEITSGPLTARNNLPQGLVDAMVEATLAFPEKDPEGFKQFVEYDPEDPFRTEGYMRVDHDRYQWIVDMRDWLKKQRRS